MEVVPMKIQDVNKGNSRIDVKNNKSAVNNDFQRMIDKYKHVDAKQSEQPNPRPENGDSPRVAAISYNPVFQMSAGGLRDLLHDSLSLSADTVKHEIDAACGGDNGEEIDMEYLRDMLELHREV
jgi:hypothetical protein